MDAKNYQPETSPSRRPLFLKYIIGAILISIVAYAAYTYFYNTTTPLSSEDNYQSSQVSDEQKELLRNSDITGYLQITRIEPEGDQAGVEIVNYHPGDDTYSYAADDGEHINFYPSSSSTGSVLELDGKTNGFQAITYDFTTGEYYFLPRQKGYYAYSAHPSPDSIWYAINTYKAAESETIDLTNMENWDVRLYDTKNDAFIHLQGATSPRWFNDGKDIIFLKKDGIYRYNLASGDTTLLFDLYTNISGRARIAMSDTSDYIVLTLPTANTMAVLRFDDVANNVIREVSRITNDQRSYDSPVFAPHGTQFAVISASSDAADITTANNTLEIYSILDTEPIYTRDMDGFLSGQLLLTSWQPYEIIAPYRNSATTTTTTE